MKFKFLYYRIRQFILSIAMVILNRREQQLVIGANSIYQLPKMLDHGKTNRILLITTKGSLKRGLLTNLILELENDGITITIYSDISVEPTLEIIDEATHLYLNHHCQAIVAIGGGSVLDCAKGVGIRVVKPGMTLKQMSGILKIRKKLPDIYAIPTTAGTGSEVSGVAVITDGNTHYKYTINDLCLGPRYAILDPMLTISLPPYLTACSGIDALIHAIEAYTNRFRPPKARRHAKKAVKLIAENLSEAYYHPDNLAARENMLRAAHHAGIAFYNSYVGNIHALAHGIGAEYGLPHGEVVATVTPVVLEQYGKKVEKQLGELADLIGILGETDTDKSARFIAYLRGLNKQFEISDHIEELDQNDFSKIARKAVIEANPTYPVPEIWDEARFCQILLLLQ